jgi:hypothetical protein
MAFMQFRYIQGRDDFLRLLRELLQQARELEQRTPGYLVYTSIRRQLEAIDQWTADGREPTREERRSIFMGRLAARELEALEDSVLDEFTRKIGELDFYVKHWKDDEAWRSLDREDQRAWFPDDD